MPLPVPLPLPLLLPLLLLLLLLLLAPRLQVLLGPAAATSIVGCVKVQHKLWTGQLVPALLAAGALSEPRGRRMFGLRVSGSGFSYVRVCACVNTVY